jgi:CHAT domain-containing protein/tetratricopeptide (TPR) repeat protein
VKPPFLIALALCTCITSCKKDTKPEISWGRTVEPRLSRETEWHSCKHLPLVGGRIVEQVQCAETSSAASADCPDVIETHDDALQVLKTQTRCTGAAITALERFAAADATALSDVAAAYYVRAQREDSPSDFLRALQAAEQAVTVTPRLPAAHFNRALAQEALGLTAEAQDSWNELLRLDRTAWANEAREHLRHLARLDGAQQWAVNRNRIPAALAARDQAALARLIAPFPSSAERYLQSELLPQWAEAPTGENLARAKMFAGVLASHTRNRYVVDAVNAITPATTAILQEAHLAFRDARSAERNFESQQASYRRAAQLFASAGSPFRLFAELGLTIPVLSEKDGPARALALIEPIEREAARRGYGHLLARIQSVHANVLIYDSRYIDALTKYEVAREGYEHARDPEGVATIHIRLVGIYRVLGQPELAWREVVQAHRGAANLVEQRDRHLLTGETAETAVTLRYPRIALAYQNAALRRLREDLSALPRDREQEIKGLQRQIGIALRARAGIHLHLEHYDLAKKDLDDAIALAGETGTDTNVRRAVLARAQEVQGALLLRSDPNRAIAAFDEAFALAASSEYATFRAALLAQRAEAKRRAGHRPEAESDLRLALGELRAEEARILGERERGQREDIWSLYFSRFQETYHRLIGQLVDEGRHEEAFLYAERSRAFEPLNLILKLPFVPKAFRELTPKGDAIDAARIRRSLPAGTVLVEYCVGEERTFVWIVSRDRFEALTLPAGREDVERWTGALQRAAADHDARAFERALYGPYSALLAEPLRRVGPSAQRLVFVPDGAMHGLPLAVLRDPVTRQYVMERAPIEIAGSAALYLFSLFHDRELSSTDASVLLVGDPTFNPRLPLARELDWLPYARIESQRIRELYGSIAEMRIAGEATVPEFLRLAQKHSIVHLAVHAIVNAQVPSRSLLLFAPSEHHTGALDAQELLTRLHLDHTRLVVLSACSSAGGLPVGPEGVAPLVRPLITSGVPGVVGSLWDVDDATAAQLLVSFHRHYRQGSDAAAALQRAQLDLLKDKNPGFSTVLAWAPFQVIGHASSPFAAQTEIQKEKPP